MNDKLKECPECHGTGYDHTGGVWDPMTPCFDCGEPERKGGRKMSRLEEIKKQRQKKSTALDYIDLDIDWLIQQAERVKELENLNKLADDTIQIAKQENKRYKQALEEIEKANYWDYGEGYMHQELQEIARKALKGESDD
jgi:hypothetical protein